MKTLPARLSLFALTAAISTSALHAQPLPAAAEGWHAKSLGEALIYMVIFGLLGIALAILGYKMFDRFTPGDLHKEIIENKNVAAALIGAAVVIGTCIIVAAAMVG